LEHLSATGFGRDVAAVLVVWIAIVAIGLTLRRLLLRTEPSEPLADATAAFGLGVTGYGAVILLIGFAPLLRWGGLTALTLAASCLFIWSWRDGVEIGRGLATGVAGVFRSEWLLILATATFLLIALMAGFRPPQATDEIAYHWPAPELWASVGHWVMSPFRFTNSFDLAEVIYTPAAVFRSSTAAHWTDTGTFVMLALGAAALARRFGGLPALAWAGVIAIPAAAGQSWLAYNDVFAASLVMAACVVATSTGAAGFSTRVYWTAGILLAGAISVKPIMILLAPLPVLLAMRAERRRSGQWSVRDQVRTLVPMAIPSAAASVGWMAYSKEVTGRWFQSTGFVVAKFGNDPTHGLATIRLPTLPEFVVVPFLPVATGIIGQREPFGGRTGLVLVVFIPVMVITAIVMDRNDRLALARLAVPVLVSYLIAGIVIVRTRFLLVDYAAAIAAATCTVAWWNRRSPSGWGPVLHWSFRVLVLLGLLDTVRHAVN
jgi:hypothetical protein